MPVHFRISPYALIRNDAGEILLLQRPSTATLFPNQWELPGGKPNTDENIEEALCREILEETGLRATPESFAGAAEFALGDIRIVMLVLNARAATGPVRISGEHQAFRWVRQEDIFTLPLTAPVRTFFERLRFSDERR